MLRLLFKNTIQLKQLQRQQVRCVEQMVQFTNFLDKKKMDEQQRKVSSGKSWRPEHLRLKSTEDLHKLWILSDNLLKKKLYGKIGPQGKMSQVKVSMARLLTIISEREKVCKEYRKSLEDEYVQEQRKKYEEKLAEQTEEQKSAPIVPEITHQLLFQKYKDLQKGIDDTSYIEKAVKKQQSLIELKKDLDQKYGPKQQQDTESSDLIQKRSRSFKSFFEEQLKTENYRVSEQEVLRAHIKNWKQLSLKQRRIIINFLQARRAGDARSEFMKELSLLRQKIAFDSQNERMNSQ